VLAEGDKDLDWGKVPRLGEGSAALAAEVASCGFSEADEADSDYRIYCRLGLGHKGKHQPGKRVKVA
jgi:hypothetical protein